MPSFFFSLSWEPLLFVVQYVRHLTGQKHKIKSPVSCRTYCTCFFDSARPNVCRICHGNIFFEFLVILQTVRTYTCGKLKSTLASYFLFNESSSLLLISFCQGLTMNEMWSVGLGNRVGIFFTLKRKKCSRYYHTFHESSA